MTHVCEKIKSFLESHGPVGTYLDGACAGLDIYPLFDIATPSDNDDFSILLNALDSGEIILNRFASYGRISGISRDSYEYAIKNPALLKMYPNLKLNSGDYLPQLKKLYLESVSNYISFIGYELVKIGKTGKSNSDGFNLKIYGKNGQSAEELKKKVDFYLDHKMILKSYEFNESLISDESNEECVILGINKNKLLL